MSKKPLLSEMTLREKIGQTALGRPSCKGYLDLEHYPYGGLWSLGNLDQNVMNMADRSTGKQVTTLKQWGEFIAEINKNTKYPILQAMDCTAGIRGCFSETEHIIDCCALGATASEELSYEAGMLRARLIRSVGSRWIWCPEIDRAARRDALMLGRQYSDDPELVLKMSIAEMKGTHAAGVASTVKHFPGMDRIEYRDPHVSENMIFLSYEKWKKEQGYMFQRMFDEGMDTVMIAHRAFPAYDPTRYNDRYLPASVSHRIVTDLLKGEMGFKGVAITDGIEMRSLVTMFDGDMNRVYVEAIKAGNDMVLGVRDNYFDAIEQAVLSGEIPESRIDDACQRVLDLKEKYGLFDDDYTPINEDVEVINADLRAFNEKVAKKALSLVCNKRGLLPLKADNIKHVTIIYSGHDETGSGGVYDSLETMKQAFEKRGATVLLRRALEDRLGDTSEIDELAANTDLLVYAGYLMRYAPEGANSFFDKEVMTFHYALCAGAEKSVGIGLGSPYMYYDFYSAFPTFINAYNPYPETQEAVVAAMYGEIPFEGGEPFGLIPEEVVNAMAEHGATL
ncbi:MAG: glycoside hydrolase family 3 protein [Clostridia bacterium]|nr:glycoside hydrolase family 3 protein [Clostridia bacterium]